MQIFQLVNKELVICMSIIHYSCSLVDWIIPAIYILVIKIHVGTLVTANLLNNLCYSSLVIQPFQFTTVQRHKVVCTLYNSGSDFNMNPYKITMYLKGNIVSLLQTACKLVCDKPV